MQRALILRSYSGGPAGKGLVRVVRRRLATASEPLPSAAPKKKKGIVRRVFFWTTLSAGGFYVGSPFLAFWSPQYYDFFSENVPLGQATLDYSEAHNWDTLTPAKAWNKAKDAVTGVQKRISGGSATQDVKETAKTVKTSAANVLRTSTERVKTIASEIKTNVEKSESSVKERGHTAAATFKHQADQFTNELNELIHKAETALAAGKPVDSLPEATTTTEQPAGSPTVALPPHSTSPDDKKIYEGWLPLGFEPPAGYSRPTPPPSAKPHEPLKAEAAPPPLPLLAPAVSEFASSEPVITQLASTIDDLASYLNTNPAAATKAVGVLETAKVDLTELSTRIQQVREEEKNNLEQNLDEQAREFTFKLMELEIAAQDKFDSQEDGFRKLFEEERAKVIEAYREKLNHELKTQTELINERLREEVIAQGIELQRRWIREVKVHVEEERGGRLAKLEQLAENMKKLERVALDNSSYLDDNIRVHGMWGALRALNTVVESPTRKPFREELRVLRHVSAAKEDAIVLAALDAIESTDIPDIGVEPIGDLISWFTTSVAPRVSSVALVPEQNAGVLSHLASHLFSSFRFRRHGLAAGSDTLSVLARAEYYLNEKDLDSAARELNQLKGTARLLLTDWLDAARRRLEVQQVLEVVRSEATLAALLLV